MEENKYCDIQDNCKIVKQLKNEIRILQEANEVLCSKIKYLEFRIKEVKGAENEQ